MVCNRCVMVVDSTMKSLGYTPNRIDLGEVHIQETELNANALTTIADALNALGFELIDDKKARLIEQIKNLIIQKIHHSESLDMKLNWSAYLSDELHYDYNYLSSLFSSVEGVTLEQYIIKQKIEKVKELIVYDELNISEIANQLAYSSVAHLSAQFKKITGLSPSAFKKSHQHARKAIDKL